MLLAAVLAASLPGLSLATGGGNAVVAPSALANEITSYAEQHRYSGGILIERGGQLVLRAAFGLANREFGIRNRVDTRFKQASITKLFTSTMVMMLYDQGRLDIERPITAYLPDYQGEGGDRVTIYQLMTATSGLADFEPDDSEAPYVRRYGVQQLLTMFCSGGLIHEPGTTFNYNNADYIILTRIVERLTGTTYANALRDMILGPLGMKDSGVIGTQVVPRLAESYAWDETAQEAKVEIPYAIGNYYGAGAMYSTLDDLRTFSDALYGGKLLKPSTLGILLRPDRAAYACGLWVSEYNLNGTKTEVAERQGSIWGTTNRLLRLLDRDITIILLTNMDTTELNAMQVRVMSRLLGVTLPHFDVDVTPASSQGKVGSELTFTVAASNGDSPAVEDLLDVEIKDASGERVRQFVTENLTFASGETKTSTIAWTPEKPGRYTVTVGIFQMGWRTNLLWRDGTATITIE